MKPVIAVVGPTASGKTSLSIALAKALDTQIVCMDSMQVYRYMDIGTAKPSLEERDGIIHHMLDVADPDEPYSVADYVEAAEKCIDSILKTDRIPILVGGTGLYHKAISGGMTLGGSVGDEELRAELNARAQTVEGKIGLHEELRCVDPQSAEKLHYNDTRRVIRALEVYRLTGHPISAQQEAPQTGEYDLITIGVGIERPVLVERIRLRIHEMIKQGLADEVRMLLDRGISPEAQSMQGLGYKEMVPYVKGYVSLDSAIEQTWFGTRRYAKRQMTWFRRTPDITWLDGLDSQIAPKAMQEITGKLKAFEEV